MLCLTSSTFCISTGNEGMNQQIIEISSVLGVDEGLAGFEPRPLRKHYATDDLITVNIWLMGPGRPVSAVKGMRPCPGACLCDAYFLNE